MKTDDELIEIKYQHVGIRYYKKINEEFNYIYGYYNNIEEGLIMIKIVFFNLDTKSETL